MCMYVCVYIYINILWIYIYVKPKAKSKSVSSSILAWCSPSLSDFSIRPAHWLLDYVPVAGTWWNREESVKGIGWHSCTSLSKQISKWFIIVQYSSITWIQLGDIWVHVHLLACYSRLPTLEDLEVFPTDVRFCPKDPGNFAGWMIGRLEWSATKPTLGIRVMIPRGWNLHSLSWFHGSTGPRSTNSATTHVLADGNILQNIEFGNWT